MSFFSNTAKKFCPFLSETPSSEVTNLNTKPMDPLPFENFSLDALNSQQKNSVKKPVDRPVNQRRFRNLPVGSGRENPDRFYLCNKPLQLRESIHLAVISKAVNIA